LFPPQTQTSIDFAAELFRQSKHAVALTGAGISTPSGIPDFRSTGTGLWSSDEPMEVASPNTFRTLPEKFFQWFRPLASQIFNAPPNPAHISLAKLEKAGCIKSIITQNIDTLHQKAGSQAVIEMHGTMQTLTCTHCYHRVDAQLYLAEFVDKGEIPHCPKCCQLLKPDVILFGEQLPVQAWLEAVRVVKACDLILVAGSSLEVMPVANLPLQAIENGAHLIIVNHSRTYLDVRADVVFWEDVTTILPMSVETGTALTQ